MLKFDWLRKVVMVILYTKYIGTLKSRTCDIVTGWPETIVKFVMIYDWRKKAKRKIKVQEHLGLHRKNVTKD